MRTKIIATLGPSSNDYEVMKAMVTHGVRIFRLNFSHADAASFEPVIANIRALESELDTPLTAMGDLCGPKTRIGVVEGSPLQVDKGATVALGLPGEGGDTDLPFLELDFPELLKGLEIGMPVSLSDGMVQFQVSQVLKADTLFALEAQNSGSVASHKGIAFPGKHHAIAAMTDKDRKDLAEGIEVGLDAVALSFVQHRSDIEDLKTAIERHGRWLPVVAKLERQNAVDNLDAILEIADAVMVARGDLGLECPLAMVPVIQKRIIRAARHAQKATIVATQMLLSMVHNPLPTRAESTDVANAVMDGADCLMLSEETAVGSYPVKAVQFMEEVANNAESYYLERTQGPFQPKREKNVAKYLTYAACLLADNADSKGLVCHSTSGATARLMASRRPAQPVFALTPRPEVIKYLNFFWGVHPHLVTEDLASHVDRAERFVQQYDDIKPGESVIITSGQPTPGQQKVMTNEVKIYHK